jgi:hypothetical protein
MPSFIRRRLTYANVVCTLCLFIVLGGGAYAASSGGSGTVLGCVAPDGTLHVIKAGQKCGHHQRALAFNKAGLRGPSGPAGATGPAGAQGVQGTRGPVGPSHAFSASTPSVAVTEAPSPMATLTLPPGSYSIVAKLWVEASDVGNFEWVTECTLKAGSDTDTSHIQSGSTSGSNNDLPMSMALLHAFGVSGSVTVECGGSGGSITVDAKDVVITATQVEEIN